MKAPGTFMVLPALILALLGLCAALVLTSRSEACGQVFSNSMAAIDSWKRAWKAEHDAMEAWRRASNSQGKLVDVQRELLEERAKYIVVLEQALREGTRVIFGEGQSATEWRLLPQESAIGSTRQ